MKNLRFNPFFRNFRPGIAATSFVPLVASLLPLGLQPLAAADYSWNTTSETWNTTTPNWAGAGTMWVDGTGNNATFANTATASTITLGGDRTAGTIVIGNATNNCNYNFTGSGVTLNGTSLAFAGSAANDSQDHLASHTVFNGSLNLALTGNVTIRRGNLEFGGTGTYNVGNITTSGDWGVFRMSGSAAVNATALLMGSGALTGSFDLNGGTLTTGTIAAIGTGNSNGNTWTTRNTINGATIRASQSNNTFLTVSASSLGVVNGTDAGNNVWIGNGGATFDSNGFNIGTATVFRDDTGSVGSLTKLGNGTLTLSSASTYTGATNVQAGTLRVNGSLAAGSAVTVSGGAALGGTGTINGPVTVASGATAGTQGAISLLDGALGTFTLTHAGGLTLGGTAGNLSSLKFDVGAVTADLLSLGANVLTVGAGGAAITITGTGVAAGNTYDLVSFGSGAGAGFSTGSGTTVGELTLANPNISFGVSGSLTVTADKVQLVTAGASAPGLAYWSGVKGATWASNDGTNGNFTTNADGTGFVGAYPSSFTDVIFAANGNGAPANLANTLGQDFAINSLTFASGTAAVTISGGNQLTLDGGIFLESGNGGATLAMTTLVPGNFQTWANSSASDLTVSAAVTGANGLNIDNTGAGKTILTGINTYSGGTTLTAGTLRMSGSGTLGAATGSLTINDGVLDLNGTSQSVGLLSGTGGTILNNGTGTSVTLTIGTGNATGGEFGGVIADNTSGTGTVALTKVGSGRVTFSGANTYTGTTTINAGTLQVGADETIPDDSVVEINGGELYTQAFTETIGGLSSVTGNINLVQNQENGGSGTGNLIIDTAGNDYSFDGIIRDSFQSTGTLAVVKNGAGVQTITATNNYLVGTSIEFTGGLTINGGTFRLLDQGVTNAFYTNGKVINTFASDVMNNATFALESTGPANVTFSKVISGTGAVTTTGLVTLSATNTYTGSTSVGAGTLSISQPYLADGSSVAIAATGKLDLAFVGSDTVASLTIAGSPAATGTWGTTASGATHPDDTHFSGTGTLLVGAGAPSYSTWAAANAGGQASNLDYDNDGVKNGVEYFMGQTGSSFTANPGIVGNKVIWPKDPAFSGNYTVQTSPDLSTWTNASSIVVDNTIEYSVPQNQGKLFVRLDVTPN